MSFKCPDKQEGFYTLKTIFPALGLKKNKLSVTIASDGFEVVVQTQLDGGASGVPSGAANKPISVPTSDNTSRHYPYSIRNEKNVNPENISIEYLGGSEEITP